jgi:hypothetical protein
MLIAGSLLGEGLGQPVSERVQRVNAACEVDSKRRRRVRAAIRVDVRAGCPSLRRLPALSTRRKRSSWLTSSGGTPTRASHGQSSSSPIGSRVRRSPARSRVSPATSITSAWSKLGRYWALASTATARINIETQRGILPGNRQMLEDRYQNPVIRGQEDERHGSRHVKGPGRRAKRLEAPRSERAVLPAQALGQSGVAPAH